MAFNVLTTIMFVSREKYKLKFWNLALYSIPNKTKKETTLIKSCMWMRHHDTYCPLEQDFGNLLDACIQVSILSFIF